MVKAIALALFIMVMAPAAHAQWSVAGGVDFAHDHGHSMLEARYFGQKWDHWTVYFGLEQTVGAELFIYPGKFELGWGLEFADQDHDIVDTSLAYQLRVEYRFKPKWSIGVKHRSNCRTICDNGLLDWARIGDDESTNKGFNFLYLRRRF